jgi:signal transduction histidine kinase
MVDQEGETKVQRALDDLMALVPDTVALTRRLSVDLSPPILQGEGLAEALAWLTSQMREQYGLRIDVSSRGRTRQLDEGLRILVFQVLRELLFNVVKHAGVSQVEVSLAEHGDWLHVIVDDAGKGFDVDAVENGRLANGLGRGLATSRQRLELVGGGMTIRSAPDGGTTITITVPLPPRQEAGERSPS